MTSAFRLPSGGRIERDRPLRFHFNAHGIDGYQGDTIASALLANGVHLMGRSFKYHRPRGPLTHGSDEPNALLSVSRGPGRRDPNSRATVTEAVDGLTVTSQNHWPSLRYDIGALNDWLSPLLPAGFYYKTFMWPRAFWDRVYEPAIRAAAGLGVAPSGSDPDRYVHRYAHCDVLIVGAGPTGLAAALAASESGQRVMLVDEQAEPGGALLHDVTSAIEGLPAWAWLKKTVAALSARANVILLSRATAFGYYNHNHIVIVERVTDHMAVAPAHLPRERLWQVRAGRVVLTTGAHERPLVFAGNDRPGIMLAESVRAYVNRYAVAPGRRIVFVTTGASAYQAARDAKAVGLDVTVLDVRREAACGSDLAELRAEGIEVITGHTVVNSTGRGRVTGLIVAPLDEHGRVGTRRTLPCDCVGMSGGWTPAVHLFSQSRGKLRFEDGLDAFVANAATQSVHTGGACRGTYDLGDCLADGWHLGGGNAAGIAASRAFAVRPRTLSGFLPTRVLPTDSDPARTRAFIDFQNDVTAKDIGLAVREGFESIEHVKRYTTTGMATDQGKTSNMTALGLVSEMLSRPVPQVGTTTFRPPYTPVTFGALVGPSRGELFDPIRKTPIHEWAERHGAKFENVSAWRRAWYFPRPGEDMHAAVSRECRAVRTSVGIFDASTLGKIEVVGVHAVEFMNRMYVNSWSKLEVGRCRYGLMLKEDGYIFDDGVVARLAADRFHVTTTTSGAPRVLARMEEYLQTEWPELDVFLTSVTDQWAVISVQGPRAREVIAPLVSGVDLSSQAFPHMSVRVGHICGVPTRLFRVSFTGELGYEINVPADYGRHVWEAIYANGQAFGITEYGTEAMYVLRAERGFIIVGQDTDGTVTPDDAGLGGMVGRNKPDFIGKRSLARADLRAQGRRQLVGLLTDEPALTLEEGAQIVLHRHQGVPMQIEGHVTSSYSSDTCGRSIALALIANGRALKGTGVHVTTRTGFARARITDSCFFDPKGERAHA